MKQVFIANSTYTLLLYLLRFPQQIDETLFVLGPSCAFTDLKHKIGFKLPADQKALKIEQNRLLHQVNSLLNEQILPAYGDASLTVTAPLIHDSCFYPVSDGLRDEVDFPNYVKRFPKLYGIPYKGGKDFQHPKIEYMDLKALFQNLSDENKRRLMQIYQVEPRVIQNLKNRRNFLITQPLSEDHVCTEEEKQELYRRILSNYEKGSVVLKPHPREKTNWQAVFPDTIIAPQHIPMQLLQLLMPKLEKVITLFSTAAFTAGNDKIIDFYSKDFAKLKYFTPADRVENNCVFQPITAFDVEKAYRGEKNFNWLSIPDKDGLFYPAVKQIAAQRIRQGLDGKNILPNTHTR